MASDSDSVCSSTTDFSVVDPRLELLEDDSNPAEPTPPFDTKDIIEDLYEGPQVCGCCVNWVDDFPSNIGDKDPRKHAKKKTPDDVDEGLPIVVRRWARWSGSGSQLAIDSIEIRHAATRAVLHKVFEGYSNINAHVRILVFKAPFKPFFWRWAEFKAAIAAEEDAEVRRILTSLHDIVKTDLADVFTVYKELVPNGVITSAYVWTLFAPGDILYEPDYDPDGIGSLYSLQSITRGGLGHVEISLNLQFIDWDGDSFGVSNNTRDITPWTGSWHIRSLPIYPVRFARNSAALLERFRERGQRFAELTGKQYMSFRPKQRYGRGGDESNNRPIDERIVLDTKAAPLRRRIDRLRPFTHLTSLISQVPVRSVTEGFHSPLPDVDLFGDPMPRNMKPQHRRRGPGREDWEYERPPRPPPPGGFIPNMPPPPPPPAAPFMYGRENSDQVLFGRTRPSDGVVVVETDEVPGPPLSQAEGLTDLQLQLCAWSLQGFSLKNRRWENYPVHRIHEIEFDPKPFDNLVLPEGYKDLILAFVESQVKDKDSFGDLINGKGGGLTILLSGAPGVGKTLTAESVAEKIKAPLYKLELGEGGRRDPTNSRNRSRDRSVSRSPDRIGNEDFTRAFELCAAWGAVLLIDECDLYLEKRSDYSSSHNSIVTRFLRELEYYPSLLFLTTNRERSLDPAVYSRVHLTINYPQLDRASRLQIWKTFLNHMDTKSDMSEAEVEALADIDVDGRRVRNVVKTARILAKRQQRAICFNDVKNVMRITESLVVEKPE
ncbi:P-loop containing nucleoside triphosphate hydrolase protein [Plectosphaerella plurivora]|uniref:P-loop containing nucleoside triphosphate hydrolase protein n=1 Tax=Plectosphaerella plurivora TaxID=936078 RepID=A0A9P9A783_9PEZI|nr:P-loop containing nucleoside triphosphate hydrolase protein [Plectosphaerella plurivora]